MTEYSELLNRGTSSINTTKIYIGYLPVSMNDAVLREAFEKHCEVSEVIIKKGNAQGHFEKFCYGFVTMNLPEKEALQKMARIADEHPNWRLKVKEQGPQYQKPEKYQRQNYQQQQQQPPQYQQQPNMYHLPQQMQPPMMQMQPPMQGHQPHHQMHQGHHQQHQGHQQGHQGHQQGHQGHHQYQQHQPQRFNHGSHMNFGHQQQEPQNDKGLIFGQKKYKIMVRELWLGGIPEMIDHHYMTEVMSQFGLVEATEIFPKFAFVKYKRAIDAAIAYERASKIFQTFGQNSGFRIAFSDPSRRKQIVGNHYEFEKTAVLLPVLFLGFPPITSANVQINHMMGICEKFGTITNYYLKKSTNTQMRSYILFTYDNLKNALRAKQELSRRKDLLGEKRVEITLLLDQESVTKGRDFSNTQRNFINTTEPTTDRGTRRPNPMGKQQQPFNQEYPAYQPNIVPGNYPNVMMQYPGYGYPPSQYPPPPPGYGVPPAHGYYPPIVPPFDQAKKQAQQQKQSENDVLDILHSVYDEPEQKKKGPQKKYSDKDENTTDIIRQMLGKSSDQKKRNEEEQNEGEIHQDHGRQKEPNWSGFVTWKGSRRTGVDGFAVSQTDFSDYSINVSLLISNEDVLIKDKANVMILEPTNSISQPIFNEYLKVFKKKTGICMTKNWLIYLMGRNDLSQTITSIKDNQLLVVMEKPALASQLKDKTMACNESYFE